MTENSSGIDSQRDVCCAAEAVRLVQGLSTADLQVPGLDAGQSRAGRDGEGSSQFVEVHDPGAVHRERDDRIRPGNRLRRREHGCALDRSAEGSDGSDSLTLGQCLPHPGDDLRGGVRTRVPEPNRRCRLIQDCRHRLPRGLEELTGQAGLVMASERVGPVPIGEPIERTNRLRMESLA